MPTLNMAKASTREAYPFAIMRFLQSEDATPLITQPLVSPTPSATLDLNIELTSSLQGHLQQGMTGECADKPAMMATLQPGAFPMNNWFFGYSTVPLSEDSWVYASSLQSSVYMNTTATPSINDEEVYGSKLANLNTSSDDGDNALVFDDSTPGLCESGLSICWDHCESSQTPDIRSPTQSTSVLASDDAFDGKLDERDILEFLKIIQESKD